MLKDLPNDTTLPARRATPDLLKNERDAVLKLPVKSAMAIKRVRFVKTPPAGAQVILRFPELDGGVAVVEESSTAPRDNPTGADFDCVCVESNPENFDDDTAESVRVNFEHGFARLRPGRVLICADKSAWDGMLLALTEFCLLECELRNLEREIAADWGRAEQDVPLANHVGSKELARQEEIGAMMRTVFLRRIRLAKIERALAKSQVALPTAERKFAARLRRKFDVVARAEVLDGRIEVYEYIYEMASQRLGEYGNFRREYILEWVIVGLLASELIVMLFDFFMR